MIIDLERFVEGERRHWEALESALDRLEKDPGARLTPREAREFHYLYERASADLAKVSTFASEPALRQYLETLVARAYGEVHEARERATRIAPVKWFFGGFPGAFRRHTAAFALSVLVTLFGSVFGAAAAAFDPEAKPALVPFPHLVESPAERVAREERTTVDRQKGVKATFSAVLIQNNIKVSSLAASLGMAWGFGTAVVLFYNGVILGVVASDYVSAGRAAFLAGWLLPHGAVEIPAILIAGQAGLILGGAVSGWGTRASLRKRLRSVGADVGMLLYGTAVLLVWAGLVEAFLSQYHEPVVPYFVKIALGVTELVVLAVFLARSGKAAGPAPERGSADA